MQEHWPSLTWYQRFESLVALTLTLVVSAVILVALLIALEFNHTLQYVVTRVQSIIQIKVVLLIALLALARKFIVLDMSTTSAAELLSLAAATLALGITYGLIRDARERQKQS